MSFCEFQDKNSVDKLVRQTEHNTNYREIGSSSEENLTPGLLISYHVQSLHSSGLPSRHTLHNIYIYVYIYT